MYQEYSRPYKLHNGSEKQHENKTHKTAAIIPVDVEYYLIFDNTRVTHHATRALSSKLSSPSIPFQTTSISGTNFRPLQGSVEVQTLESKAGK